MKSRLLPFLILGVCALFAACADEPDRSGITDPEGLATDIVTLAEEEEVIGLPLKGLTGAQMALFLAGQAVFERVFVQEDGLGPIFNASACAECHEDPGSGGPGDEVETHFSRFEGSGTCNLLDVSGGNVLQDSTTQLLYAATGYTSEPEPDQATVPHEVGRRSTPDVLGFGLFEAIPAAAILALADPNDVDHNGISGRAHMAAGLLGRFGRKAGDPSLDAFNAGAFLQEMGITNPSNPHELNIGGHVIGGPNPGDIDPSVDPLPETGGFTEITQAELDALNAFMRFLAPPAKLPLSNQAQSGKAVFKDLGCIGCHVENFTTASPVAALNNQKVQAFSDFLLHDIGTGGSADNCQGDATASEFRTEPLTGLRLSEEEVGFLHDGSAKTIQEAILRHGGEAAIARAKFSALSSGQVKALLAYLRSI